LKLKFYILFTILLSSVVIKAQSSNITGTIKDSKGNAIEGVSVSYNKKGTTSNKDGAYILRVPENKTITIIFSHVAFNVIKKRLFCLIARPVQSSRAK